MNYLAHAYLSFGNPELLLGNMISDFVKGKKQFDYPTGILHGIRLHRAIDSFTDEHPATAAIKELFRPAYRLYAGALTDVIYDHFLANDSDQFANEEALLHFTTTTYEKLDGMQPWHGTRFGQMSPYMKLQNWLFNYRFEWGIQKSLEGVRRRSAYITETDTAFQIFLDNKDLIRQHYQEFFPSVKNFAAHTIVSLAKT